MIIISRTLEIVNLLLLLHFLDFFLLSFDAFIQKPINEILADLLFIISK